MPLVASAPGDALAHTSERGHVMLLPTGYYSAGGAVAVALSFVVLALMRPEPLERLERWRLRTVSTGSRGRSVVSLAFFALLALLVIAGFFGSRDPLSNPLPLTVWTLFWVGLTLLSGFFGNLWTWINPWHGPYRLIAEGRKAPLRLPEAIGYWPAILIFFAFAWFELIYPAPDDPWRLALVVLLYWLANFVAMLTFGYEEWTKRGEIFSVFFGMIARLAVLETSPSPGLRSARSPSPPRGEEIGDAAASLSPARRRWPEGPDEGARHELSLCLPSAQLATAPALPISGVLFLLLALASVSFDGLMRTFFWLGLNGVNPLEFPGRSAVIGVNSAGLIGMFALLTSAFLLAVLIGGRFAGNERPFLYSAGVLVWSIIPISLAYHFAHYLTALLVNGQYTLAALSEPFSIGWNLFGTAQNPIHAGVAAGHEAAWLIWNAQVLAIVGGHMLAIVTAHVIAYRLHGSRRAAVLSQIPLGLLMVAYTVFGLWLLSTPTAG